MVQREYLYIRADGVECFDATECSDAMECSNTMNPWNDCSDYDSFLAVVKKIKNKKKAPSSPSMVSSTTVHHFPAESRIRGYGTK